MSSSGVSISHGCSPFPKVGEPELATHTLSLEAPVMVLGWTWGSCSSSTVSKGWAVPLTVTQAKASGPYPFVVLPG